MINRYQGTCHACRARVPVGEGEVERIGRRWKLWCQRCYDASDNSSFEDRACGNRAYEDACERATR